MALAYIGIGSNLGDREENCREALRLLEGRGMRIVASSAMHETEPWGVAEQPSFINMAVGVETGLEPRELLEALKGIEAVMGRVSSERYGPRLIDLDILLYDDRIVKEPGLEIPHPRMHERQFVLQPLAEIAPDARHPITGKTVREMKEALSAG